MLGDFCTDEEKTLSNRNIGYYLVYIMVVLINSDKFKALNRLTIVF